MTPPSALANGRGDATRSGGEEIAAVTTKGPRPARAILAALAALAVLAAAARLFGISHGLPFSFYPDEAHFVKRAVAFGSGDLNPHWFHKPALLMYILFFQYGLYYIAGSAIGLFSSVEEFAVSFFLDSGPFYLIGRLTVAAFGVASVVALHVLAARAAKSAWAGLAAALFLALAIGHVATSQDVKEDVPCAFFVILSLLSMIRFAENGRAADAAGAGVFMGLGMAVKYYPIFLLPPLVVAAFAAAERGPGDPSRPVRRDARAFALLLLALVLFLAFFFVGSPFNFLDPTWYDLNLRGRIDLMAKRLRVRPLTDPLDLAFGLDFKPRRIASTAVLASAAFGLFLLARRALRAMRAPSGGVRRAIRVALAAACLALLAGAPAAVFPRFAGQLASFFETLLSWNGLGPVIGVSSVLAAFFALASERPADRILAVAFVAFVSLSGVWTFEPIEARHLNVAYPILAALLAGALARGLPDRAPLALRLAVPLVLVAPGAFVVVRDAAVASRLDTRTEMARWIEANVQQGARILNDKGWVPLANDTVRARELHAIAASRPGESAFEVHRARQYELMIRAAEESRRRTFYVIELDEPWWEHRERPDGSYGATPHDRDMGNPYAVREPKPLDEYRKEGIRFVVTTSKTYRRAESPEWRERWPKFAKFYDELEALEPIHVVPESATRPGPTVRLYDLLPGSAPGGRSNERGARPAAREGLSGG